MSNLKKERLATIEELEPLLEKKETAKLLLMMVDRLEKEEKRMRCKCYLDDKLNAVAIHPKLL